MLSKSPQRHTFQRDAALKHLNGVGAEDLVDWYEKLRAEEENKMNDPEWQKDNMEYDLLSTPWILEKVRASKSYAQNLYAALCNTDSVKNEIWPILKEQRWSCSWRHSGGIVADMRQEGDYIDWYCSGISESNPLPLTEEQLAELTSEQLEYHKQSKKFVPESVVTDEIRADLLRLGWIIKEDDGSE